MRSRGLPQPRGRIYFVPIFWIQDYLSLSGIRQALLYVVVRPLLSNIPSLLTECAYSTNTMHVLCLEVVRPYAPSPESKILLSVEKIGVYARICM